MISEQYLDRLKNILPMHNITIEQAWSNLLEDHWRGDNLKPALFTLSCACLAYVTRESGTVFSDLIAEMVQLHENKNAGYSGLDKDPWRNFRECNTFGISTRDGILTRMCDKFARYLVVSKNSAMDKVNESLVDTVKDLAAYSIILTCIIDER